MRQLRALTRMESRSIDARAAALGLSTLVLMENAGRGAADSLRRRAPGSTRVVTACGPGNNGGDGGVVARHLDAWGFDVHVAWIAPPERLSPDARVQFHILESAGIPQIVVDESKLEELRGLLARADAVVDALFGTGLTRPPEGLAAALIDMVNAARKPVLALDLPSGLDADSGRPQGRTVRATWTATFVAPKVGFNAPEALEYLGEVEVVEIGVPSLILRDYEIG